jgi:arylformamidase
VTAIDYEAEYNCRARVPEHPTIFQEWTRGAAAYRESHPPTSLRYGPGERHRIDLFRSGEGPVVLFIHGGYWQATDRSLYSHLARGLNQNGVSVALMSYDLCPAVRIGDIVAQAQQACSLLWRELRQPVVASGHSAGGHLAACLLATEAHVPAAYSISGVFELAPLIATSLNNALRLDEAEALAQSPLFWRPPPGKALDAVVGAAESGEFLRQSRAMVDRWGQAGIATRYEEMAGANHFTVVAPLADPASQMCARIKAMADASR